MVREAACMRSRRTTWLEAHLHRQAGDVPGFADMFRDVWGEPAEVWRLPRLQVIIQRRRRGRRDDGRLRGCLGSGALQSTPHRW